MIEYIFNECYECWEQILIFCFLHLEISFSLAELDRIALLDSKTEKLVAAVGKLGLDKGVKVRNIIKAVAKALGGGGGGSGGKPDLAQGGGPNVARLDEALRAGTEAMRA